MEDYEYPESDPVSQEDGSQGKGPKLPGGLSVETAASGLLVIVLVALLWLFFGPQSGSDEAPGLPTATPTSQARSSGVTPRAVGSLPAAAAAQASKPAAQSQPAGAETPSAEPVGPVTSAGIAVGTFVRVGGTDGLDLRLRFGPGTEFVTIRIVPEGEILEVLGGPESADGATWWRLRDSLGNVGWAAQDFLTPIAAPAAWNPPAASPTFPPQGEQSGAGP